MPVPDLSKPTASARRYIISVCADMWGRNRLLDLRYESGEWLASIYNTTERRDVHMRFYRNPDAYRELGYSELEEG